MSTPGSSPQTVPDPRFPIGKFSRSSVDPHDHRPAIADLEALPENLRAAIDGLSAEQIDTPYRDGGWTVRQLIHHVADSHSNAYIRFRLALTEDWPTIKPYEERLWAELFDARSAPVDVSLEILAPLHRRWVMLLESLSAEQWQRGYMHPVNGRQSVTEAAALYAWHSRHHTAHVTSLRKRMGW